jgi:hypothetical protein
MTIINQHSNYKNKDIHIPLTKLNLRKSILNIYQQLNIHMISLNIKSSKLLEQEHLEELNKFYHH